MITCNIMGGLGNQLFQIFTTISYSIKHKKEFAFLYTDFVGTGKTVERKTYWNNFLKPLKKHVYFSLPPCVYLKEQEFSYNEILKPVNEKENICLYGYFQSYKYFHENSNTIIKLINLEEQKRIVMFNNNYSNDYLEKTVSLHFRIGDYKLIPNVFPILTYDYYEKSILFLNQKLNNNIKFDKILYFCENKDLDDVNLIIDKLKLKYSSLKFIKVNSNLEDWEQMLLMSCCRYNIIANSSFSWWSAYLNNNKYKIICYPEKWFGVDKSKNDTKDLFLNDWNKIV